MFKQIIAKLLANLGYMITKLPTTENQIKANKFRWLQDLKINTVLDIGANDGGFVININKILPEAFIYTFEPLTDIFNQLKSNTSYIKNIKYFNFALGEIEEERSIYRNVFSPSSSFLKMKDLHKKAFPHTANFHEQKILVKTLDSITNEIKLNSPILFKLDVQGYEISVLKGSLNILKKIDVVITETSFYQLYEKQAMFKDIFAFLTHYDFTYVGNIDQFLDPNDGKVLQADSVFIRSTSIK